MTSRCTSSSRALLGVLIVTLGAAAGIAKPLVVPVRDDSPTAEFADEQVVIVPQHGEQVDSQPPYAGSGFTIAQGGVPGIPFMASGITLYTWITVLELSATAANANTCWGYTSPSGREYAIIGVSTGTAFVEVTDPGEPEIVSFQAGPESLWRDMKVYGTYAYCVSEGGGGIQVFDLANIDNGVVSFLRNVTTGGATATHTVFVNEESGYLYRCGGQSTQTYGIRIYDLNPDPSNPTFVGQWNNRYVHECQVVNWTTGPFAGREIAFVAGNDVSNGGNPRVNILDVTNKASITQISAASYPNAAFAHQSWLSPDRRYMYLNDELDENTFNIYSRTRIFDVQNLSSPLYVGSFESGLTNIDHNLYTKGNLIFESNYRAGLRVYDATNPVAPVPYAYFDTYPDDDNPSFNGLWNNYPYFASGTIIGSDIEKGLFVWRLGDPELSFSYPNGTPELIPSQGGSFIVEINTAEGITVQSGSPKLRYNTGAGEIVVDLVPLSGNQYRADIPPLPCGTTYRYYVTARSSSGLTARDPSTAPVTAYDAAAGTEQIVLFDDDMQSNLGWTVGAPGDSATSGLWIRADPVGTAAQPEDDASIDGTVCWITGNAASGAGVGTADVDGGNTTLTSPVLDAVAEDGVAVLRYYRWYSNDQGASPNSDSMPIQISNNNGSTWTQLELVSTNDRVWVEKSFRIDEFVTPTSQMRVRFIARDEGSGSIVEAGVDEVRITFLSCVAAPPAFCNGDADGDLDRDFADITTVLASFGTSYLPALDGSGDADHDGDVDFSDVTSVLASFGAVCE